MRCNALSSSLALVSALVAASLTTPGAWTPVEEDQVALGGLVTLHADDPLGHDLGFETGTHGSVIQNHMVKNHQSDLDFGCYNRDALTVGIEGGKSGSIIDLGPIDELGKRYGFSETVGGGQGFASIRAEDGKWLILANYEDQTTQQLKAAQELYSTNPGSAKAHAGHVYLARIVDSNDPELEILVKLVIVAHEPDRSVTLRWQRLK